MINLFEYQNKIPLKEDFEGLEIFLDDIWINREKSNFYKPSKKIESQGFLQFLHKTKEIKSNKYVGVIHYNGQKINLLPKVFFEEQKAYSNEEVNQMQNHILWWLSYCRKIKFPNYQSSLGNRKSDFFEVLIHLFSKYTRNLLNGSIYQQYEEINKELSFIKGRLNINAYIQENLSKGNWHKINCTYDAFVFDNEFNRIIKYVSTLLFNASNSSENKKNLREILFILDEVTDDRATAEQCANIKFNPMFGEFETVRDYCQLFLANSVSFDYKNDLKLFAFLLPMEYVFEDFIYGFIQRELEEVSAKAQIGNVFLDTNNAFKLKPDLLLQLTDRNIIADTKYKIIYTDEADPKKGISQNDLYQMLAYAIRFKVDEIILFYPKTIKNTQSSYFELSIQDRFAEDKIIKIKAYQLSIINPCLLHQTLDTTSSLESLFDETKQQLIKQLENILF